MQATAKQFVLPTFGAGLVKAIKAFAHHIGLLVALRKRQTAGAREQRGRIDRLVAQAGAVARRDLCRTGARQIGPGRDHGEVIVNLLHAGGVSGTSGFARP